MNNLSQTLRFALRSAQIGVCIGMAISLALVVAPLIAWQTVAHIAIEAFLLAVGAFAIWSIQRDLRRAFRIISRGR